MAPRGRFARMRFAILLSNVEQVEPTWTTMHLAHAALQAGHGVRFIEPRDYEVTSRGQLVARSYVAEPPSPGREELCDALAGRNLQRRYAALDSCEILLIRVNPLTEAVLNLALLASELGVQVVNDPVGIARTHSKAWLAGLRDVPRPLTLVTQSRASARLFAGNLDRPVVVKPAQSSGGRAVSLVSPRRPDLLEDAMDRAQSVLAGPVVIQACIPEADQGEKRLVWMDGEILGGYLRRRSPGEFRHNLRCGSSPLPCEITAADRALGATLAPHLARNGIRIAGLDVIGNLLVEVNTLNPGGVHYAELFARERGRGPELPTIGQQIVHRLLARSWNAREVKHA